MTRRAFLTPNRQYRLLKLWHVGLAASFVVAYVSADEDTYLIHQIAGYTLLALLALRLVVALRAVSPSPWRPPRPSLSAARAWITTGRGRHPLFAWFAAALLAGLSAAALTGALADAFTFFEDLHEALAEATLCGVVGHVLFMLHRRHGAALRQRLDTLWRGLRHPPFTHPQEPVR